MGTGDYLVRRADTVVESWSRVALPFQHSSQPWTKGLRDEIRASLKILTVPDGQMLRAEYSSLCPAFRDVENVLLYNVGSSAFKQLVRSGLQIERRYQAVSVPVGGPPAIGEHHMRYGAVDAGTGPEFWNRGVDLIRFEEIELRSLTKVAPIWLAIRRQTAPPVRPAGTKPGPFGVRVVVRGTAKAKLQNLAELVKPLLDGIISAAHTHDEQQLNVLTDRLVANDIGTSDEIRQQLMDERWSALGVRQLLRPVGAKGVQWNPADDRCVFAEVLLDRSSDIDSGWEVTAEIFAVSARTDVNPGGQPEAADPSVKVPGDDAGEAELIHFALSFNAAEVYGTTEQVAEIANSAVETWTETGELPGSLDALRTSLYFEQRRHRHLESNLSLDPFVRALVEAIRTSSTGSVTVVGTGP